MAWVKIKPSVISNHKFLRVGPEASWLWVCALTHCRQAGTGNFVHDLALSVIGVRRAGPLVSRLVAVGLFEAVAGGWLVVEPKPERRSRSALRRFMKQLLAFWGQACVYCGATETPLEIEHIVPCIRGGSDDVSNLTIACQPCNRRKARLTAAEFGFPQVHEIAKGLH